MAEFLVRAAELKDVPGVVALDRATELLPHWAESDYAAAVAGPLGENLRRCLFVAEVAGELAGFGVGMAVFAGKDVVAELESVAVAASARRLGVAKALCGAVIGWARESGACAIELEVRRHSAGAVRLYEGIGFREVGWRVGYYKGPVDDAVLMRLAL